jgi:hypothetical protein
MPYVTQNRRDLLKDKPWEAENVGDYNYLFTLAYLAEWLKDGNQRYHTIHSIKASSIVPDVLVEVKEVDRILQDIGVSILDRQVARELAFHEFYRRIGCEYEDFAVEKNGDVKQYEEAIDKLYTAYTDYINGRQ